MSAEEKDFEIVEHIVEADESEKDSANPVHDPVSEDERQHLLQMSEISLLLDTYDDIFSDFDPRPYSQRALSDDFLFEAKKASKEKTSGRIELRFLIPAHKRDMEQENIIRRRLHEHFRKHYASLEEDTKRLRRNGLLTALFGFGLIMFATYISQTRTSGFLSNLLFVVFEPSGWFVTWSGLDRLLSTVTQKRPDLEFYRKMSKVEITFTTY